MMNKNFKNVEKTIFGQGSFNQLGSLLDEKRYHNNEFVVFLIDDYFKNKPLSNRIPATPQDMVLFIDVTSCEPTTQQVDFLRDHILSSKGLPVSVVGIGGGRTMDIAKAVSLMLTQKGSSVLYQGLNLIKNPGIYHIGIPTLSGTGAEVSMTAVLTGPEKKLGIKCDETVFNQIILDSKLMDNVPINQWFYTGMDTYIHCIESKNGAFNNAYSSAYADQALQICRAIFLNKEGRQLKENADHLMIASFMGGLSLTYSEVGVCHALSYGLSKVLGLRHGYANCIAFQHLADYYKEGVEEFKQMIHTYNINLPHGLSHSWTEAQITEMSDVSYNLSHMWNHALGKQWRDIISLRDIKNLFRKM